MYVRLNSGGSFEVRHSVTNAAIFSVNDGGVGLVVDTGDLADGAVTLAKLGPNSVDSSKIVDGSIVDADISGSAGINGGKLGAGSISGGPSGQIAPNTIASSNILDGTIVDADISGSAGINGGKIAAGTLSTGNLADGSVTSVKILDGTIVNADINAGAAIAYSKLSLGGSIVNGDINAAAAIALAKLAPGSAGVLKSNGSAISAGNAIVTGDMVINTISGDRLADGSVPGAKIAGGIVPATVLISRQAVGALTSVIDFVQIPTTYSNLFVRLMAQFNNNQSGQQYEAIYMQLSSNTTLTPTPDTGANYNYQFSFGVNAAQVVGNGGGAAQANLLIGHGASNTATLATFGLIQLWLPDYLATTRVKKGSSTTAMIPGLVANAYYVSGTASQVWNSTGQVRQIRLFSLNSFSFVPGTIAELWGEI